jgi:hypothetical protein
MLWQRNDINSLAPVAIAGNLVNQSFSSLVPKVKASKHKLPSLIADPLKLEAPDPSNVSPGPNRLHVSFDEPLRSLPFYQQRSRFHSGSPLPLTGR